MNNLKPITAVPYFGGKTPYVNWLYPLFPKGVHLVDAMCGSATVAINANRKDFPLVTINDLNQQVINFFRVLRENFEEFERLIFFTPFARQEFYNASEVSTDPVENARRFYVRSLQGYAGMGAQNEEKGWGYECAVQNKYNGKSRNHFRVTTWSSKSHYLHVIADRLRLMQVENLDVVDIIKKYDRPGKLIYLDPPYLKRVRSDKKRYRHEMVDQDHIDLATAANEAKCFVAISGYNDPFYTEIFAGWTLTLAPVQKTNTAKKERQECLWTNYDPASVQPLTLF